MICVIIILSIVLLGYIWCTKSSRTAHLKNTPCGNGPKGKHRRYKSTRTQPEGDEHDWIAREKEYQKQAAALKKAKKFRDAANCLIKARDCQYRTSTWYTIREILRIPETLLKAECNKDAYAEAMAIASFKWKVNGMISTTMEETKCLLRLEALRIAYKAALAIKNQELILDADRLLKEFREEHGLIKALGVVRVKDIKNEFLKELENIGNDLGRICEDCQCLNHVLNDKWNGTYISVLGKTQGLPSIDDALNDGIFCAEDCSHRVDHIDPIIDDLPPNIRRLLQ